MKDTLKIKVAAVQIDCKPGKIDDNLLNAKKYIQEACIQGAKLILLPELVPSGYMVTEEIWEYAEKIDGRSVTWLLKISKEFNIYIGFSFLEVEGEDFYNTFVLADPNGKLAGRVRKNPPASIEAYFYRAGSDNHIIETDIGKIGIGICYENLLFDQMCSLYSNNVDLVLSPAAAGRPKSFLPGDIKRFEDMLIESRKIFAQTLNVPIIMANRVGLLETELPGNLPYLKSSFPGLSSIVDYNGSVKGALGDQEGIIVAEVCMHSDKITRQPKKYGKQWAVPVPWYSFIWPLTQKMGEKSYKNNLKRKEMARKVSQI